MAVLYHGVLSVLLYNTLSFCPSVWWLPSRVTQHTPEPANTVYRRVGYSGDSLLFSVSQGLSQASVPGYLRLALCLSWCPGVSLSACPDILMSDISSISLCTVYVSISCLINLVSLHMSWHVGMLICQYVSLSICQYVSISDMFSISPPFSLIL